MLGWRSPASSRSRAMRVSTEDCAASKSSKVILSLICQTPTSLKTA